MHCVCKCRPSRGGVGEWIAEGPGASLRSIWSPKWSQDCPKLPQDCPKWPQDGLKVARALDQLPWLLRLARLARLAWLAWLAWLAQLARLVRFCGPIGPVPSPFQPVGPVSLADDPAEPKKRRPGRILCTTSLSFFGLSVGHPRQGPLVLHPGGTTKSRPGGCYRQQHYFFVVGRLVG